MSNNDFRIGINLSAHSQQLKGVMDALSQAVDAARTVGMPSDAYGLLCRPFRMMLDPVEQWGLDALQEAVDATETAADQMQAVARTYQETEQESSSRFRELH